MIAVLNAQIRDKRIHIENIGGIADDALREHFGRVVVIADLHLLVAVLKTFL